MRTEQLEYVAAVARLGSFRRAAEELHISQPALSETVRNLERELGVDIFERDRSGASLSADGRDLLSHVSRRDRCGRRAAARRRRPAPRQPDGAGGDGQRRDRAGAHPGDRAVPRSPSEHPGRGRRRPGGGDPPWPTRGMVRPRPDHSARRRRRAAGVRLEASAHRSPGGVPASRRSACRRTRPSASTICSGRR